MGITIFPTIYFVTLCGVGAIYGSVKIYKKYRQDKRTPRICK